MKAPANRAFLVATIVAAMLAALFATSSPAGALDVYVVTDDGDSGPGTLREALQEATTDADDSLITFAPGVTTIALEDSLEFDIDGGYDLTIDGGGVVVVTADSDPTGFVDDDDHLLDLDGYGKITLKGISFLDAPNVQSDGANITNTGGSLDVVLHGVTAEGNRDDGVYIGTDEEDYSLYVTVTNSVFNGNGDGEGEEGDSENGLEIDNDWYLDVSISGSVFNNNWDQGFDSDTWDESSADYSITDSTFRNSGDDGMEITENDSGNLAITVTASAANDNGTRVSGAEGLDANENDEGDFDLRVTATRMNDNADDGMTIDENGTGDLTLTTFNSSFDRNGEDGIDAEEGDDGVQNQAGSLTLRHFNSTTNDNGNGSSTSDEGLDLEESGSGSVSVLVFNAESTGNFGGSGLDIDGGGGIAILLFSDLLGNGNSAWDVETGVFVLPIATPG